MRRDETRLPCIHPSRLESLSPLLLLLLTSETPQLAFSPCAYLQN
jgi:hypothetical protein